MNKLNNCKRFVEIVLDEIGREQARGVMLEDIDVDAVIRRVKCWPDEMDEDVETAVYGML